MFTTRRSVVRSHVSWTLLHPGVLQQQGSVLFRHAVSEQLESVASRGEVGIVSIGAAIRRSDCRLAASGGYLESAMSRRSPVDGEFPFKTNSSRSISAPR